jgi:hypothetical protein
MCRAPLAQRTPAGLDRHVMNSRARARVLSRFNAHIGAALQRASNPPTPSTQASARARRNVSPRPTSVIHARSKRRPASAPRCCHTPQRSNPHIRGLPPAGQALRFLRRPPRGGGAVVQGRASQKPKQKQPLWFSPCLSDIERSLLATSCASPPASTVLRWAFEHPPISNAPATTAQGQARRGACANALA